MDKPAWIVLLDHAPVLPEVISCLAGLAKMRPQVFVAALLCGTVPMGFTYAAVGAMFDSEPAWALALSVAVPRMSRVRLLMSCGVPMDLV
mgnify:CR=1 FL=1